jgi:hypothetical protein
MTDLVKKLLTRKTKQHKTTDTTAHTEVELEAQPSEKLVLGTKFAIALTVCLAAIEVAHLALLGSWNSEVFAAITGLSGTIMGILITQKS